MERGGFFPHYIRPLRAASRNHIIDLEADNLVCLDLGNLLTLDLGSYCQDDSSYRIDRG